MRMRSVSLVVQASRSPSELQVTVCIREVPACNTPSSSPLEVIPESDRAVPRSGGEPRQERVPTDGLDEGGMSFQDSEDLRGGAGGCVVNRDVLYVSHGQAFAVRTPLESIELFPLPVRARRLVGNVEARRNPTGGAYFPRPPGVCRRAATRHDDTSPKRSGPYSPGCDFLARAGREELDASADLSRRQDACRQGSRPASELRPRTATTAATAFRSPHRRS